MILTVKDSKGSQYNVPRASAMNQKSLLLALGSHISLIRMNGGELGKTETIVGMLMQLSEDKFDRICSLVAERMVMNGTSEHVDIKMFQGRILTYFEIIADLIKENLSDFFTRLSDDQKDAQ